MNNIDITVIIPFHDANDENVKLLNKAVMSVDEKLPVVVSLGRGIDKSSIQIDKEVSFVESEGVSFQELVNEAVSGLDSKWFTILEFDDRFTGIWLPNMLKYVEYMPNTSVFMTMEDLYDFEDNKYIGIGNEAPWASSFSNEIGCVDLDCLQNFFDFYLTGSLFNTDDWREVGGLKVHIENTFWYEFLLRATNKGKRIFVVPKIGYTHYLGRRGSYVDTFKEKLSQEEIDYWFKVAKKEYFFKEDRQVEKYGEGE